MSPNFPCRVAICYHPLPGGMRGAKSARNHQKIKGVQKVVKQNFEDFTISVCFGTVASHAAPQNVHSMENDLKLSNMLLLLGLVILGFEYRKAKSTIFAVSIRPLRRSTGIPMRMPF